MRKLVCLLVVVFCLMFLSPIALSAVEASPTPVAKSDGKNKTKAKNKSLVKKTGVASKRKATVRRAGPPLGKFTPTPLLAVMPRCSDGKLSVDINFYFNPYSPGDTDGLKLTQLLQENFHPEQMQTKGPNNRYTATVAMTRKTTWTAEEVSAINSSLRNYFGPDAKTMFVPECPSTLVSAK